MPRLSTVAALTAVLALTVPAPALARTAQQPAAPAPGKPAPEPTRRPTPLLEPVPEPSVPEAAAAVEPPPATSTSKADADAAQPPFTMNFSSRIQLRYSYIDPGSGDPNGSFGIRRARFTVAGDAYEHFDYSLQLELPGGSGPRLIDAFVRIPIGGGARLWVGQGKALFGRQQLTSSGRLQFVDRAIVDRRFAPGRQQGIAVIGTAAGRRIEYGAGVYNGNGINTANDNGRYLAVARAVWTPLGAYSLAESAHDRPASPRLALGLAGLTNSVGNGENRTDLSRLGAEAAFKVQGLNLVGELFQERAETAGVSADTRGWYAQAGYLLPGNRHEIAGRVAAIQPRGLAADQVETGVAYSYYLRAHNAKVQADFRSIHDKALNEREPEFRLQLQLTL